QPAAQTPRRKPLVADHQPALRHARPLPPALAVIVVKREPLLFRVARTETMNDISPASAHEARPNNLDSFWMPFSDNRVFKSAPRMLSRAKGMHYFTPQGQQVLDGTSGLWCCNAGHGRREITEAIQRQAAELD